MRVDALRSSRHVGLTPLQIGAHLQVFQYRHLRKEAAALRHVTNTPTNNLVRGEANQGGVLKRDGPGAGLHEPGQGAQNGAFAGTVGANEADYLTDLQME